jgi:hypothetical protein
MSEARRSLIREISREQSSLITTIFGKQTQRNSNQLKRERQSSRLMELTSTKTLLSTAKQVSQAVLVSKVY